MSARITKNNKGAIMAKIYLVRHCESEGNACRRTQAQVDALVTTKGYQQAEMLRRRFAQIPVDAVYSSDAFRALMTAEPIARDHGAPVRVRISLRELTTGVWEDMAWGNIAEEYPVEHEVWNAMPWKMITPGATTFEQTAERLLHGLRRIAEDVGENGTAVAVSHSCAIKSALCMAMGKPISGVAQVLHSDNTAVSLLDIDREGNITIEYMNDASHLPAELKRAWNGVAGSDLNMAVNPVRLPEQEQELMTLVEMSCGSRAGCQARLQEIKELVARHPKYVAMCYLKGKAVGYVRIGEGEGLSPGYRLIERMYVRPELEGKGYCEQLFGYATYVLRYEDVFHVVMKSTCGAEERRVMDRFTFTDMEGHPEYRVLDLACRPCPYPVLA